MSRPRREPGASREPVEPTEHAVDEALRGRLAELDEPLRLTDAIVRDGDLSNLRLHGAELRRVAIERTRMLGLDAARAQAQDLRVTGASLQLGLFTEAELTRVTFERVDLREASFAGARLQDVLFADCRMDGADFRDVRVRNCAVRGCTLDGAEGLPALLRGTTMPWPDVVHSAGALALALGVEIESD